MSKLLYISEEWTIEDIRRIWDRIATIGRDKYKLDFNEPLFQMVTKRQMLELAAVWGRPVMYDHWSFGKELEKVRREWETGRSHTAYEMIFQASPSLCYIMEENNTTMQTLVLAHAAVGHASFSKNNKKIQEFTTEEAVLPRLKHAKRYISECEKKYGEERVERLLDSCHALMWNSVDRYKRKRILDEDQVAKRMRDHAEYNDLNQESPKLIVDEDKLTEWPLPEENILYYFEKNAPYLKQWEKEILRIVRLQAQYFYPKILTKTMNEGWASFWHYTICKDLYEEGSISEGNWVEILHNHTNVLYEPTTRRISNPYNLGFEMWMDIKRACENPTEEDYEFLPLVAGTNWLETFDWIMRTHTDETFIYELLGPQIIKKFKMYAWEDDSLEDYYEVFGVQSAEDVDRIRNTLADGKTWENFHPTINIVEYDKNKDRKLVLEYVLIDGVNLDKECIKPMQKHLARLWKLPVELNILTKSGNLLESTTRKYI